MGRMKEIMIELQERGYELSLAKTLGVSINLLDRLEWEIIEDSSKDGMTYGYYVDFSSNENKSLLKKIPNIDDNYMVFLHPWEIEQSYDNEELFEVITNEKEYVKKYDNEIRDLKKILLLPTPDNATKYILNRQIFIAIIGNLETFLSDVFINLTFDNPKYFRNFIEKHPEFKKRKFELKNIFTENELLEEKAKKVMLETIYHNLPTIKQMYQDTFEIRMPDIDKLQKFIKKRHDLVHRNGKTKEGELLNVSNDELQELFQETTDFVYEIIAILNI